MQHVKGFGRQRNGLRPTPETGVVWIEAKVSEAPLREGHPHPPLLPLRGRSRQRGVKTYRTTVALRRHSKTRRAFTKILQYLYATFTAPLRLPSPHLSCSPASRGVTPSHPHP